MHATTPTRRDVSCRMPRSSARSPRHPTASSTSPSPTPCSPTAMRLGLAARLWRLPTGGPMNSEVAAAIAAIVTARLGLAVQKRWSDGIDRLIPDVVALTGADDLNGAIRNLRDASFDTPAWRRIMAAVTVGETRFLRQRSWFQRIEHT